MHTIKVDASEDEADYSQHSPEVVLAESIYLVPHAVCISQTTSSKRASDSYSFL